MIFYCFILFAIESRGVSFYMGSTRSFGLSFLGAHPYCGERISFRSSCFSRFLQASFSSRPQQQQQQQRACRAAARIRIRLTAYGGCAEQRTREEASSCCALRCGNSSSPHQAADGAVVHLAPRSEGESDCSRCVRVSVPQWMCRDMSQQHSERRRQQLQQRADHCRHCHFEWCVAEPGGLHASSIRSAFPALSSRALLSSLLSSCRPQVRILGLSRTRCAAIAWRMRRTQWANKRMLTSLGSTLSALTAVAAAAAAADVCSRWLSLPSLPHSESRGFLQSH